MKNEERRKDQEILINLVQKMVEANALGVKTMQELTITTQTMLKDSTDGINGVNEVMQALRIEFTGFKSDFKALIRETQGDQDRTDDALKDHETRLRAVPEERKCLAQDRRITSLEAMKPTIYKIVGACIIISLILPPFVGWALKKVMP